MARSVPLAEGRKSFLHVCTLGILPGGAYSTQGWLQDSLKVKRGKASVKAIRRLTTTFGKQTSAFRGEPSIYHQRMFEAMLFYLQCCCILNHCGNLTQYGVNATTQSPSCVYTDDLSKNLFDYTAPNTKSRDKCLSRICIESCGVKQMFPDRHEIESMPTKEGATGTFHGHITTNNKTKQ